MPIYSHRALYVHLINKTFNFSRRQDSSMYLREPGPLNVGVLLSAHAANHPVVVHRVDDGGVLLGALQAKEFKFGQIKLVIQTLPLVTALRKKGSSFPANLANSSYFSRPLMVFNRDEFQ